MPRMLAVCLPDRSNWQHAVNWEGWGTSLAWWAHAAGNNAALRQQLCTLLFSKDAAKGLGMNIVRYNIGGANPAAAAEEYRTGAAVPCLRLPDGSYNWGADAAQVAVLLEAAGHGADMFEAFVNSPPYFWTVSGSSRGHKQPLRCNLPKQHIQDFAAFCADVLQHFQSVHGICMQSLSPFNEPGSIAWCLQLNNRQEGCYFSKPRSHKVLRALAQHPALQGTQLIAFEQFCCHDTLSDLRHLPKDLWPEVHRVNTHTYTSKLFFQRPLKLLLLWQDSAPWRRLLHRKLQRHGNKPLWVSEFGTGRGALSLAKQILKDLSTLTPTAWVFWQAVEGLGTNWGLLEAPLDACSTAAAAAAAPQVLVHHNFFVLQFLMQCMPAGCCYTPVKQLGQFGVLVHRSCKHVVLVFLNTSSTKPQTLAVDAGSWLKAAAAAAAAHGGSSEQAASGIKSSSVYAQAVAGTAAAADAAAAEVRGVQVLVTLLDLQALQSVQYDAAAGLSNITSSSTVQQQQVLCDGWPLQVEVPAASLCRLELLA